jgi:hypothetical protein
MSSPLRRKHNKTVYVINEAGDEKLLSDKDLKVHQE